MKLKNVRVGYRVAATINTGNFTNVRPEYEVSADVPDGLDPSEAVAELEELADAWLEANTDRINAELNGK
jgi:hypothetical protein